jgi:hypothetical protein
MQEAHKIVELLKQVRERPPVWIGGSSPESLLHFLHGVTAVASAFGVRVDRYLGSAYGQVITERGWEHSAAAPVDEMRERRLSDQEIVQELLTIEIETWKRAYQLGNWTFANFREIRPSERMFPNGKMPIELPNAI